MYYARAGKFSQAQRPEEEEKVKKEKNGFYSNRPKKENDTEEELEQEELLDESLNEENNDSVLEEPTEETTPVEEISSENIQDDTLDETTEEETPVEEPVQEEVVEEESVEEITTEETDENSMEELAEEETPVEEPVQEETEEEPVEEITTEETDETSIEESAEEETPVDEPVQEEVVEEESVEEITTEETDENSIEEPTEEETLVEEPVQEQVEETSKNETEEQLEEDEETDEEFEKVLEEESENSDSTPVTIERPFPYLTGKYDKSNKKYKLDFYFLANLCGSSSTVKEAYVNIKNAVMQYRKGKWKVTNKFVKFSIAKFITAKLMLKYGYFWIEFKFENEELALQYELTPNIKKDVVSEKFPYISKVKTAEEGAKFAELINDIITNCGKRVLLNREYVLEKPKDYQEKTDESLLNDGLARISIDGARLQVKKLEGENVDALDKLRQRAFKFKRSYLAKLHQLNEDTKSIYLRIVNKVLEYVKGNQKIMFKKEGLLINRHMFSYLEIRGKSIFMFLPFGEDTEEFTSFNLSKVKKENTKFPSFLKLDTKKNIESALSIIDLIFSQSEEVETIEKYKPYTLKSIPDLSTEDLLNTDQIKLDINYDLIVTEEETVEEPVEETEEVEEEETEEVEEEITDEVTEEEPIEDSIEENISVEEPVQEEIVEEVPQEEPVEEQPKEEVKEETSEDEPTEIPEEPKPIIPYLDGKYDKENKKYKLDFYFLANLHTATDDVKQEYVAIKNAVMHWKKGKWKVTNKFVKFGIGKYITGKLLIKYGTIWLELNVEDPELALKYELEPNKKRADEVSEKYPYLVKLKSVDDGNKIVELINEAISVNKRAKVNEEYVAEKPKDYPDKTDEALLNDGLIRISIGGHRVEIIENAFEGQDALAKLRQRVFRFNRSYLAKLQQLPKETRQAYLQLVNTVLSYEKGNQKILWKKEGLLVNRHVFSYLEIKGKSIYMLLPFTEESDEFKTFNLTKVKKEKTKFPSFLKLDSKKAFENAINLVNLFFISFNKTKHKEDFKPYKLSNLPELSTEDLLNLEQIRLVINKALVEEESVDVAPEVKEDVEIEEPEKFEEEKKYEEEEEYFVDLSDDAVIAVVSENGKLVAQNGKDPEVEINPLKNLTIQPINGEGGNNKIYDNEIKATNSVFELRKDYFFRAIDEGWVTYVEEAIPYIEKLIKNPRMILAEEEEIVMASQARKITSRSVRHLLQHVENINNIDEDGMVVPSKLLNVYYEETIKTYENKFLNTLILKLFTFVNRRYEIVKKELESEVRTSLHIEEDFIHPDLESRGRIKLDIEYLEKPKEKIEFKNYIFNSGVWERVEKINKSIMYLYNSPFCRSMGRDYIRGSVLRTNAILKNPDLYQCLLLNQFLDSYDNAGYRMLASSKVLEPGKLFYENFTKNLAKRYATFVENIRENRIAISMLDQIEIAGYEPKIVENVAEPDMTQFDELVDINEDLAETNENLKALMNRKGISKEDLSAFEKTLEEALEVVLEADRLYGAKDGKQE